MVHRSADFFSTEFVHSAIYGVCTGSLVKTLATVVSKRVIPATRKRAVQPNYHVPEGFDPVVRTLKRL